MVVFSMLLIYEVPSCLRVSFRDMKFFMNDIFLLYFMILLSICYAIYIFYYLLSDELHFWSLFVFVFGLFYNTQWFTV